MTRAAILGEIAWQAIDRAILVGLRLERKPVPTEDIACLCNVERLCTREQLRESLARLERQRQIRQTTVEVIDPDAPLIGKATFEAYEAIGGAQ